MRQSRQSRGARGEVDLYALYMFHGELVELQYQGGQRLINRPARISPDGFLAVNFSCSTIPKGQRPYTQRINGLWHVYRNLYPKGYAIVISKNGTKPFELDKCENIYFYEEDKPYPCIDD